MALPRSRPPLPRTVWVLGIVSLCTDLGSELVHSLLPLYLVTSLGASAIAVGWIEGAAEATALALKVFAGAISDAWGRRKPLIVFGYGLSAFCKPLFPLADAVPLVVMARMLDRIGKGVRGAPRDAVLADVTSAAQRGAAYGVRQTLDCCGGVGGPMLALALMALLASDVRAVFWAACLPGWIGVLILILYLREPERRQPASRPSFRPSLATLRRLGSPAWKVVFLGAILAFARSTEGFLLLRAHDLGASLMLAPLFLAEMALVFALSAYPAGLLFDHGGKRTALIASALALAMAHLALASADDLLLVGVGIALYGLQLGLSQGVLSAWLAEVAPADLRGTAFGVFHLASAAALLVSGASFGWAWEVVEPAMAFRLGATAALAALAFLVFGLRKNSAGTANT